MRSPCTVSTKSYRTGSRPPHIILLIILPLILILQDDDNNSYVAAFAITDETAIPTSIAASDSYFAVTASFTQTMIITHQLNKLCKLYGLP